MTDTLTPEEIEEVTHELVVLLTAERRLMENEPVSEKAGERRADTLERLRGEIIRVAHLVGSEQSYPLSPLASRKATA